VIPRILAHLVTFLLGAAALAPRSPLYRNHELGTIQWQAEGRLEIMGAALPVMKIKAAPLAGELLFQSYVSEGGVGASIRLCPNGDIFVNERLAENDREVVEGMREFLRRNGCLA
jgi:hypothetical protein